MHPKTAAGAGGDIVRCVGVAQGPHRRVLSPAGPTRPTVGEPAAPLAGRTIPDLFDEQVARRPAADAVFDGDRWLTYRELAEQATRIASALRDRGIGLDDVVAVALPRSAAMVAAFIGVLKAGAAYLPVDVTNPAARIATTLADAAVRVVVAADGEWPVEVLSVDDLTAATPFPCPALPDSLAYLNYTSGSTGIPKGVAVPHRGVARLVTEPNFMTVGPGQTFLHYSSTSFDATTFEVWGPLLTGGRVAPVPPGSLDPRELAQLVKQHGVTVLWLTAGLFHQLVEYDVTTLSEVDQLLTGGDVLAPDAVRAALAARHGKPVTNGYGPTENTVFTTCHVMNDADEVGAPTPIGTPVQHTTVYVLDDEMRPVPTGTVGELYSGGAGVARGYLNRPALTAAKFVPDPFGPPGARLYRTGDRARWRPDGTLEFVGRVDHQVKVRGYLVEPGETESVLRTHPEVADAAVVVHGTDDSRGLVAHLAPRGGALDLASVRAHVAAALPEYLRPASYQVLPRLPLTANGKIDRKALPAPVIEVPGVRAPLTTEAQRRMADVWRGLLGVTDVGATDDFFDLGGNSLLAMRLTFRIRDTFGVEVAIRDVYRAPALAGLTDVVGAAKAPTATGIVRRNRSAYRAVPDWAVHDEHGQDLEPELAPPLSLVLASAQWLTSALSRAGAALGADERVVGRLTAALQDCWAGVLRLDMAERAVTFSAETLRDQVYAAFAVPKPARPGAMTVTIAGDDSQWVLDEVVPAHLALPARQFAPLPALPHTPRVSIDRLVISREHWRLPVGDLAFAFAADEQTRFRQAQEWRQATGLPRFVSVTSPVEPTPFDTDLANPPSVTHLAHAIRALDRVAPAASLSIAERFPDTTQFRFVAVDRRGHRQEGQS